MKPRACFRCATSTENEPRQIGKKPRPRVVCDKCEERLANIGAARRAVLEALNAKSNAPPSAT